MYESELERAHGQMLEEMQSLEEDKNRAVEEAFARAQVEMKAVHENLAGESAGWALACPTPKPLALLASHLSCPHRCPDQPADAAAGAADPHQRLQRAQAAGAGLPTAAAGGPQERQGRGEGSGRCHAHPGDSPKTPAGAPQTAVPSATATCGSCLKKQTRQGQVFGPLSYYDSLSQTCYRCPCISDMLHIFLHLSGLILFFKLCLYSMRIANVS